jgi:hypothetical protein
MHNLNEIDLEEKINNFFNRIYSDINLANEFDVVCGLDNIHKRT